MRLLVVEDDHLLNNTLCYNLLAAGYTVDAAMSKSEAVNFCETRDYDLIVLDVNDKKWTGEALFNILDNAVKYTPAGGTIRVSVQSRELYIKINITDSGKGIAENRQGMIFKRFYREEEVHDVEGIGIGLYLAREIITMQGGYIKVTSAAGSGSTFSVFLPRGS